MKIKTPSFRQAPECPLESLNESWVAGARLRSLSPKVFFYLEKNFAK
jgi:hypothetical protein